MLQATVGNTAPPGPPQPPPPQMPTYQPPPPLHPTPPVLPPQMSIPPPAGPSMYQQPPHMAPQHAYYRPPPPPQPQPAPPAPAPSSVPELNIDPAQRVSGWLTDERVRCPSMFADVWSWSFLQQMLLQVLSLTQDQINGLPPTERDAIQALVCIAVNKVLFVFDAASDHSGTSSLPHERRSWKVGIGRTRERLEPFRHEMVSLYILSKVFYASNELIFETPRVLECDKFGSHLVQRHHLTL